MESTHVPAERRARLLGTELAPGPGRAEAQALAAALRDAAHALVALDPEAADPGAITPLVAQVQAVTRSLRQLPDLTAHGSAATAPAPAGNLPERSPVSGRVNALAPPLRYSQEGARTLAHVTYGAAHEGPAGGAHGGVVAAAFDELLGVAQMASGAAGYTAELTVRFRRVTPLGTPITYEAWVVERTGRRLHVAATSSDGTHVLAEASGLFITRSQFATERPDDAAAS